MQNPASSSTLELVVNEQQLQNMSQIDLRPSATELNQQTTARLSNYLSQNSATTQQHQADSGMFSFEELKRWPTRFRDNFQTKLDEAKVKSETRGEYILEVIQVLSGILIWILCFVCTIIIPIILFFIALANLDDCSARPSLPYLVLAIGFTMSVSNLFNLALALDIPILANHKLLSNDVKNIIASITNILFNCIVAFLYILSAYMVFNINPSKLNESNHDRNGSDNSGSTLEESSSNQDRTTEAAQVDCNATLHGFTYWFITLTLGAFALISVLAILLFAYNRYRMAILRGSTPRSHQTTNSPAIIITNGTSSSQ